MSSHGGGKWASVASRAYYATGAVYYIYHILGALGVIGVLATAASFFFQNLLLTVLPMTSTALVIWAASARIRREKIQLQSDNPGLEILEVDSTYVVQHNGYSYSRNLTVRARHAVEHYHHKFKWSGTGDASILPPEENAGWKGEIEDLPHHDTKVCNITFDRPLRKGDQKSISYDLSFSNIEKPAKPFLSHLVTSPLKKLGLSVKFEDGITPVKARKEFCLTSSSDYPIWEKHLDQNECKNGIEWEILHPRIGVYYRIVWDCKKE